MVKLGNSWDELLQDEFQKDYYKRLRAILAKEYREQTIYPDMYDIFNALFIYFFKVIIRWKMFNTSIKFYKFKKTIF